MKWTMRRSSSALCVFLLSVGAFSGTAIAQEEYNVKLWFSTNKWYLSDKAGKTLYYTKNDSPGVSTCVGECVENWPIFYIEKVIPGPRILSGGYTTNDFGTIIREDGKKQTTFNGWPLYYFTKDEKTGDVLGDNLKNVWYVANPAVLYKMKK